MKPTEHLTITERPGTYITVMSDSRGPIIVVSDGPGARASRYTPEEAAKLGLAILEAAGYVANSADVGVQPGESCEDHFWDAAEILRAGIAIQAETEAKDKAELEAEALELFKASGAYGSDRLFLKFSDLEETTQSAWLAVARRARELAKEATK